MSKLQDKLFGKVTIRKKLTMTTAVVFFLVLSMFTLVVVFSANTLLLQRERQNVNTTISKVVTYIEIMLTQIAWHDDLPKASLLAPDEQEHS